MVRALVVLAMLAAPARADRDLCAASTHHHGAAIDLDVQDAPLPQVLRLLTDAGHVNLVLPEDVQGKVTVHLVRVAWDAAICTIAAVHHLRVTVQDNVLLVRRAGHT